MRWQWVVMAALAALPGVHGSALAETWREESQKTVEARGIRELEIRNARGRIELVPSRDGRIHLMALKIVRDRNQQRARSVAEEIVVETDVRDGACRLEVRYPSRHEIRFFDFHPRYEVHVTAEVPPGVAIDARAASGTIRSEGIAAAQALRSVSGEVEVEAAGGPLHATTTSGSITAAGFGRARVSSVSGSLRLDRIRGPLNASTSSGSIRVTGAEDSLSLGSVSGSIACDRAPRGLVVRTSSGGVNVRGVAGAVRAGTVSGDIALAIHEPLRQLEASTTSGGIRLDLDRAVRCAIDLHTTSGTLDVELPIEMQRATRRGLSGRIRGGSTPVSLRSVSGDITVAGGS